jgi:DNA-binding winged helix-turn-helix (wHTH) protein/tetratricopeptide (TPR) repeat protein
MPDAEDREANIAFGDYVIDRSDERVLAPDGPVKLGNKAYRVLLALAEHDGRLLTKDALFSSVWDGTTVSESALTSVIKELRRALGDVSRTPRYIESVYGRGYRLLAPVTRFCGPPSRQNQPTSSPTVAAEAAEEEHEPPVVLVSAFQDHAVRDRHPYCADELREEVLSGLARFREIQLIADNGPETESAARWAAKRGYQLTASLHPDGSGVKVIARAKRLNSGKIIWADTMSLADVGTAGGIERIVRRIAGSALPAVDDDLFRELPRATDDFYDNYLLAKRRSLTAATYAEARDAAETLHRIVEERPDFGLAYPPLVRLYNIDFGYTGLGSSGEAERDRGLELAKAGLAADRGNVHAHTVLGFSYLYHGEHDRARKCFDQALALNPYNPRRLNEVASGTLYLGDFQAARSLLDQSLQIQPLVGDDFHEDSGRLRLLEGNFEDARREFDSILRPSVWAELYLALCELGSGAKNSAQRFASWRLRVERRWYTQPQPDAPKIAEWVRRHHPFHGDSGQRLFDAVDAALAADPIPQNAAPVRG